MVSKVVPNPTILVEKLKIIADTNALKKRFQIPDKTQSQWHKAFALGAFAGGILAACVYNQVHQNAGIVLGLASAIVFYFKSRVTVPLTAAEYNQKCEQQSAKIREFFQDVAPGLYKMWNVVSDKICTEMATTSFTDVKEVEGAIARFLNRDIKSSKSTYQFPRDDRPWIEAFREGAPFIEKISKNSMEELDKDTTFHLDLIQELAKVQPEAQRAIKGYVPKDAQDVKNCYVDKELVNDKFVVKPWSDPVKA